MSARDLPGKPFAQRLASGAYADPKLLARKAAVLAHALTKKGKVADADIDRAVRRKKVFRASADSHSHYEGDISDE